MTINYQDIIIKKVIWSYDHSRAQPQHHKAQQSLQVTQAHRHIGIRNTVERQVYPYIL